MSEKIRSVRLNGGDELPCSRDEILDTKTVQYDRVGNGIESTHLLVWYAETGETGDSDE